MCLLKGVGLVGAGFERAIETRNRQCPGVARGTHSERTLRCLIIKHQLPPMSCPCR